MRAENALLEAFAAQHPTETAELLGSAEPDERAELLARLEAESAAQVLLWMTPLSAARCLEHMEKGAAKEVLETLGVHVAASILRRVDPEPRQTLLGTLAQRRAEGLRRLLRYPSDSAGGLMDPTVLAVAESIPAQEALEQVRRDPSVAMYYVYALGEDHCLTGVTNLRALMLADPEAPVDTVMRRAPARLLASAGRASIAAHPEWQRFHALPVVDAHETFLGAIRYETIRAIERELGHARQEPDDAATAAALAELYGLGLSSMAEWAVATLRGTTRREDP